MFTASSTLPPLVRLDSVFVESLEFFGEDIRVTNAQYDDPPGMDNFYRYILYVNNRKVTGIYINDDELNNGNTVERRLFYFSDDEEDELEEGDVVTVEMHSVDQSIYNYFFSLEQTIEQSAATPANPVSNIQGGALGYFSAHTVQTKTTVVP